MDPFARKKRIIYITIMLAIALIAAVFYLWHSIAPPAPPAGEYPGGVIERIFGRIFGAPEPSPPPPMLPPEGLSPPPPTDEQLKINEQKQLLQLTDFAVISPALDTKEELILFYKKEGGDLMASALHSTVPEKRSHLTVVGLLGALWAPTKTRALLHYLDQEDMKSFLHIGTSTVVLFPFNIKSSSWSPSGKEVAYTLLKDNQLDLIITDASGKNARVIFRTPLTDTHIQWLTNDTFLFVGAPSFRAEGYAFIYHRTSGAFTKIIGPLRGLMTRASPDGAHILFSYVNSGGKNLTLSRYAIQKDELVNLDIATLPEKCAWAHTDALYCAVPRFITSEQPWPDQYLRGEINSQDKIVRITPKDNTIETIFDEGAYDVQDLFITADENILGFVNRYDGTLWRIKIK